MLKKIYERSNHMHWTVIIGALAAVVLLASVVFGNNGQFILAGKLGYFFVHSL